MPKEPAIAVIKRRLLGVLFIVVVGSLIALSIAIYNKAFTTTVDVTLRADHTGNQLIIDSDVKERGLIVGSVASVDSDGKTGARVKLQLDPSMIDQIPSNVTAQILPKTLFGEQYVSLIIPDRPARPIRAHDTIGQDTSPGALETETVLGDIYPLLTAVDPADLNATLTGLSDALHNRGDTLGRTLVNFDDYLKSINPHTRQLVDDLGKLGQVSLEYNNLAPDILASLKNLQTSARTVVAKRVALDNLLTTGSGAAGVLQSFLNDNEQRLIAITGQTDKIYTLLGRYSPEFTCLFAGVNHLYTLTHQAIYDNQIHLSATVDNSNLGPYKQGEEPRLITGLGPSCFGLPNNIPLDRNGHFQIPEKYQCLNDGAALTKRGESPGCTPAPSAENASAIGSPEENALVNSLISTQLGTTPDKVPGAATLLAGPLLRGQQVVVK
jgi:phospholipid/cholesterol/gamma-HCH transport system substrate-binding protein